MEMRVLIMVKSKDLSVLGRAWRFIGSTMTWVIAGWEGPTGHLNR